MEVLPIIAVIVSVVGVIATYLGLAQKQSQWKTEQEKKNQEWQNGITARMVKVETQNEVFWKVLEPHMAMIIHSPNHKDRDQLVDKLVNNTLSKEEALCLVRLLKQNIEENHNKLEVFVSAMYLGRVEGLLATEWK